MTKSITTIKEGDIFRWRYKDKERDGNYLSYWAKSCIAVARNGRLLDTFSDYAPVIASTCDEAHEKLTLTFIANFDDLEQKPEYAAEYYDNVDCVDINHSNSPKGNFYIRKGATRSEKKMREVIAYKIEKEASAIRVAGGRIESLQKELAKIEGGSPLEDVYL